MRIAEKSFKKSEQRDLSLELYMLVYHWPKILDIDKNKLIRNKWTKKRIDFENYYDKFDK